MSTAAPFTRSGALVAVAAAHAVVLSALIVASPVQVAANPAAIAVRAIAAPFVPEVQPPLTLARVAVEVSAPAVEIATVGDAVPAIEAVTAASAMGGDCGIVDGLQAALARDAGAGRALAALPPEARSVANAVMMWNGRWALTAGPVRRAVVANLRAVAAACRDVPVSGPRLVIVAAGDRPVVLAFGSGVWRWNDLLAES